MKDNKSHSAVLEHLIQLCDDLAWGRPTDENVLFELTKQGSSTPDLERLAEAFGMMTVKVEAREVERTWMAEELDRRTREVAELRDRLQERNIAKVEMLRREYNVRRVIGRCPAMKRVVRMALSIARHPINTLILGPTGSGKEVIAKTLHYHSPRRDAPFVAVNCTAIPDSLFESTMFGIEKGVATGVNARKGLVEESSGGTLFLDEVADMSLSNQAKLLRVLEEKEVLRVGGNRPVPVDLKIVAATNADLEKMVADGRFREDLYYRLNVAELRLPPLCERGDDVQLLAGHLLDQHAKAMGRGKMKLAPATAQCLMAYRWPGNVRELNNEMERAAALTLDDVIRPSDLSPRVLNALAGHGVGHTEPPSVATVTADLDHLPDDMLKLDDMERRLVLRALESSGGNKSRAAALLGITREGLRKKLLRLELNSDDIPTRKGTVSKGEEA